MRARRIDSTATALIAYAKSIGFDYVPINDTIDGLLVLRNSRKNTSSTTASQW